MVGMIVADFRGDQEQGPWRASYRPADASARQDSGIGECAVRQAQEGHIARAYSDYAHGASGLALPLAN